MNVAKYPNTLIEVEKAIIANAMQTAYKAIKEELGPLVPDQVATRVAARVTLKIKRRMVGK